MEHTHPCPYCEIYQKCTDPECSTPTDVPVECDYCYRDGERDLSPGD